MNNKLKNYQFLKNEDFYEIIRRRKLKLDEVGFAIYLRGKYCYKGKNPFPLSDNYIQEELGVSLKVLSKLKKRLQLKGVIKYDTFHGRGKATFYTMLDTIMTPSREKPSQMDRFYDNRKPPQMENKTLPNGHSLYKDTNKEHINVEFSLEKARQNFAKKQGWV
ncbi:MAG: hypothetical protein FJ150_02790 [Euryarchaeota archaeon]|nr:hypothetical protein [Euryarchaeota archaeon]